ncbi:MAG: class A beta-lactamase-related serine hydrolase [Lactobacillus sp.]|jgi:beta-lactamase class A|nr:class A beta-lactamase-related serine hydrolase [Lactobacillus sp.]MCI1481778.1 class A beta-lactamase-related serine hydrolase [Lactobacillus sp.]
MKRHIFLYSIITVICSLVLYVWGIHYQENAKLEIVGEKTAQTAGKTDVSKLPESHEIRVQKGSNAKLTKILKTELASTSSPYQARTNSLINNKLQAGISNTSRTRIKADEMSKLFLLLGYFAGRKSGAIKTNTAVKVEQADLAKGEQSLQAGVAYSYAFLLQLAVKQGNASAQRVLLRTVKLSNINKALKLAKTKHTQVSGSKQLTVYTSASDLSLILTNLYRGKIFGKQLDTQALSYLQANATGQTASRTYQIASSRGQAVLVDNGGNSYVFSILMDGTSSDLTNLTNKLNQWYAKH